MLLISSCVKNGQTPAVFIGHSLGGTAALVAASQIKSLRAVITINSPAEPSHIGHHFGRHINYDKPFDIQVAGRTFKIKADFLGDTLSYNMKKILSDFEASTLIIHARFDDMVDVQNAYALLALLPTTTSFINLNTSDHMLIKYDKFEYIASVIQSWLCHQH